MVKKLNRALQESGLLETSAEWMGHDLRVSSLSGIKVYKTGAVIAPHLESPPLVNTLIINVADDLDEPWPLEVYGRDGMALNITMETGDMLLCEAHSIIHGK